MPGPSRGSNPDRWHAKRVTTTLPRGICMKSEVVGGGDMYDDETSHTSEWCEKYTVKVKSTRSVQVRTRLERLTSTE